jgi:hypothetical protein
LLLTNCLGYEKDISLDIKDYTLSILAAGQDGRAQDRLQITQRELMKLLGGIYGGDSERLSASFLV